MKQYENISIKTKYDSIAACIDQCRDVKRPTRLATTYSRQISGEVDEKGNFILSSRAKGSGLFIFKGHIEAREDGIYMVGSILEKPSARVMIYVSIAFSLLMALLFFISMNPVLMIFGLFFSTIPFLNLRVLKRKDYLYKDIIRKVT